MAVYEVDLRTGVVTHLPIPTSRLAAGYASPTGADVLAWAQNGPGLYRYAPSGAAFRLSRSASFGDGYLYFPNGQALLIGSPKGLSVVSNNGKPLRTIAGPEGSCVPVRWWDAHTVLADCLAASTVNFTLWLVPVAAGTARPLVPETAFSPAANENLDAWRLSTGIYHGLAYHGGGYDVLHLLADGSTTRVAIPGAFLEETIGIAQHGDVLAMRIARYEDGSAGLITFDPVTRNGSTLVSPVPHTVGVVDALPFPVTPRSG